MRYPILKLWVMTYFEAILLFRNTSPTRFQTATATPTPIPTTGGSATGTAARVDGGFPDWIEKWNPTVFRQVGYGLAAGTVAVGALGGPLAGVMMACPVGLYWWAGLRDMRQESQTLRRNFPVLSNIRSVPP